MLESFSSHSTPQLLSLVFEQTGEKIVLPLGYRLLLHDPTSIFWIAEGDVDLFALDVNPLTITLDEEIFREMSLQSTPFLGDIIEGNLTYLLNLRKGQLVFSFPEPANTEQYKAIILANTSTTIYKLKKSLLHDLLTSHLELTHYISKNMVDWSTFLSLKLSPWFELNKDVLKYIDFSIPENQHLEESFKNIWDSFQVYLAQILDLVAVANKNKAIQEVDEINLNIEKDNELLEETIQTIGSLLSHPRKRVIRKRKNPLFKACQIIGKSINHTFIEPIENFGTNVEDQLYEIAKSSKAYYRKVILSNEWWKKDRGPIVGIVKSSILKPVAFIFSPSGYYEKIDPVTGNRVRVNAEIAKQCEPKAFMFYRSFPRKKMLSGWDLALFGLKGREKDLLTIALVCLCGVLLNLVFPIAVKFIFDMILPNFNEALFSHVIFALCLILIASAVLAISRELTILKVESYLDHDWEIALWSRLLDLPSNFFRHFAVGDLTQRIFMMTEMRRLLSGHVVRAFINALFSIAYLVMMFYLSANLSFVGLIVLAGGALVTTFSFWLSQKLEKENQYLSGILIGKIVQMIIGISKIRTYGVENRIFSYWAQHAVKTKQKQLQIGKVVNIAKVGNDIFFYFAYICIFIAAINLISTNTADETVSDFNNQLTLGSLLAFGVAFVSFSSGFLNFCKTLLEIIFVKPMWQRSKVILHRPSETNVEKISPGVLLGDVKVDHVYFRYDKKSSWIHRNISLHAAPGEFIGVVGPSGCGKSTLIRLLLGFEQPSQGAIYYDGKDLANLDVGSLRAQMGIILQNSAIMDGTIRDNVTGGLVATDQEVYEALRLAGFEEDLKQFPMGIRTLLMTGGVSISGGQRQRILMARVLLNKGKILILDEATNAMDNKTQEIVTRNLVGMKVTRIVVAHRLSTIKDADRIYVMDKGEIVDVGTFEDLSRRSDIFREMA